MPWRVSLRHVQQAGPKTGGWSDNFWNQAADLGNVQVSAEALRTALNAVTGNQTLLPSIRISNAAVNGFRDVKTTAFPVAPATTTGRDSDYPNTALLLKLEAPGPYVVRQWIRGIPDNVIDSGGVYNPGGVSGFTTRIATLLGMLSDTSQLWALRVLNRAVLPTPVTSVALATGIVTCPTHGLGAAGSIVRVRIKGVLIPRGLNKVWQVTVLTDSTVQLNFYTPPTDTTLAMYAIKPTIRLQSYIYTQITAASIDRATAHYTGRPTEVLGGRRRTRRRIRGGLPVDV